MTDVRIELNRLHNATNRMQGADKRVLCCCTAGLLRSPTAAMVLGSEPFNYNTRAIGLESHYALIPIDPALAVWAQEFVVMEDEHRDRLQHYLEDIAEDPMIGDMSWKPIIVLDVPDRFPRMNTKLQEMIAASYRQKLEEIGEEV